MSFLQNKIDKTIDIEERLGLTSLLETITSVLNRVKEVQGDSVINTQDNELTMDQVKQRLRDVQSGIFLIHILLLHYKKLKIDVILLIHLFLQ